MWSPVVFAARQPFNKSLPPDAHSPEIAMELSLGALFGGEPVCPGKPMHGGKSLRGGVSLRSGSAKSCDGGLVLEPLSGNWPMCHATPAPDSCAQCRFRVHGAHLMRWYGRDVIVAAGRRTAVQWFRERPCQFGGTWGVGCVLCARLSSHVADMKVACPRRAWSTKWSRYECRTLGSLQSESLKAHMRSSIHAAAVRHFQNPAAPVLHLLPECKSDEALLCGGVRQCEQWVRAWRYGRHRQHTEPQNACRAQKATLRRGVVLGVLRLRAARR